MLAPPDGACTILRSPQLPSILDGRQLERCNRRIISSEKNHRPSHINDKNVPAQALQQQGAQEGLSRNIHSANCSLLHRLPCSSMPNISFHRWAWHLPVTGIISFWIRLRCWVQHQMYSWANVLVQSTYWSPIRQQGASYIASIFVESAGGVLTCVAPSLVVPKAAFLLSANLTFIKGLQSIHLFASTFHGVSFFFVPQDFGLYLFFHLPFAAVPFPARCFYSLISILSSSNSSYLGVPGAVFNGTCPPWWRRLPSGKAVLSSIRHLDLAIAIRMAWIN